MTLPLFLRRRDVVALCRQHGIREKAVRNAIARGVLPKEFPVGTYAHYRTQKVIEIFKLEALTPKTPTP